MPAPEPAIVMAAIFLRVWTEDREREGYGLDA